MSKTASLTEAVLLTNEFKRKFGLWELYRSFVFIPGAASKLIGNSKSKLISKQFVERLQLAVTEVNGCAACSYQHTQMALEQGMSNEEISSFLSGDSNFIKPEEAKAIMFAQHFADSRGFPKKATYDSIVEEYGKKEARIILSACQVMIAGNMYGIPFSAFLSRLKGKKYKGSTLFYELSMLFIGFLLLPVAIIHGFLKNLIGLPKYSILSVLIIFIFYACNKNNNDFNLIDPSISLIEMEGEGGEVKISFTYPDWKIAGIINPNGNVNINGNSYSANGSLIQENYILKLDSLGRIDALWTDKGFSITRNSYTSLEIVVKENSTGEDFNFVIMLESKNGSKEIEVNQRKSQGYTFNKIEYKLGNNDRDSLFVKQGSSYSFNLISGREFTFYPFNGIGIGKTSFFESEEKDVFVWTDPDSVSVIVPSGIWNDELYFNGEEAIYTNISTNKESEFSKQMTTVTIPSGKSEFSVEIQYRERRVSYALYLVNNRTKKEKVINGKWIETAPTGNYTISRKSM